MKLQAVKIMQLKIELLPLLKFQSMAFLFSYPKGIPPQIKMFQTNFTYVAGKYVLHGMFMWCT